MGIKLLLYILTCLFSLPIALAYIDPGTGGYLIQSLWGWLVGVGAFLVGITIHFFRNIVWIFCKNMWKKYKLFFSISGIIILTLLVLILLQNTIYLDQTSEPIFDPSLSGAHLYNTTKFQQGLLLAQGNLFDANGEILKVWPIAYLTIFDESGNMYGQKNEKSGTLSKYDWNGTLVWDSNIPIHHELYLEDEKIFTITKEIKKYNGRDVQFDVIVVLNQTDGTQIERWSTWESLKSLQEHHAKLELDQSGIVPVKKSHQLDNGRWGGDYDYYHANSFATVPKGDWDDVPFKQGDWIVSFRHGSMIFILDKTTKDVKWSLIYKDVQDNIEGQHAVHFISDNNLMIFDNGRYRDWSRILIVDPKTKDIVYQYRADGFYSKSQGFVQEQPNKNLLITESTKGRVFEITPQGDLVWEFYHPGQMQAHNADSSDEIGQRRHIYRARKYAPDFFSFLDE